MNHKNKHPQRPFSCIHSYIFFHRMGSMDQLCMNMEGVTPVSNIWIRRTFSLVVKNRYRWRLYLRNTQIPLYAILNLKEIQLVVCVY